MAIFTGAGSAGTSSGLTGSRSARRRIAATSRAMPWWPHRSGRCVSDLLSISMTLSGAQPGIGAPGAASNSRMPAASRLMPSSAPLASMPSLSTPSITMRPISRPPRLVPAGT